MANQHSLSQYIPVQICEHVVINKIAKPFQLYVTLKSMCSGKMLIDDNTLQEIADKLDYKAVRSVTNNLKKLMALNFVGHDPKTGYYFIRSYDFLMTYLEFKSLTTVEFVLKHIKLLQPFCIAAIASYIVRRNDTERQRVERTRGRSHQDPCCSFSYSVSSTLLSSKTGRSLFSTYTWRKMAHKAGFITVKPNLKPLGIKAEYKAQFIRANPSLAPKVRKIKGKLFLREADYVVSHLKFKSRKKINKLKGDTKGGRRNVDEVKMYMRNKGRV